MQGELSDSLCSTLLSFQARDEIYFLSPLSTQGPLSFLLQHILYISFPWQPIRLFLVSSVVKLFFHLLAAFFFNGIA